MEKIVFTISALFIYLLAVVLSFFVGHNRLTKFGYIITLFGLVVAFSCGFLMPKFFAINPESPENMQSNLPVVQKFILIFRFGLWTCYVGAMITFVGSVLRVWQKRVTIFPFLYNSAGKG